jgi:pyruvate,water dikinase
MAYGHRALGESDVRSARYAERPEYILEIVRAYLMAPSARSAETINEEQTRVRNQALQEIRKAFGWRWHEWVWFRFWHRGLCRSQELREANRHHLMYYVTGVKRLFSALGQTFTERGLLESPDDVFFLVPDEIRMIVDRQTGNEGRNWKHLVALRREKMERDLASAAPDIIPAGSNVQHPEGQLPEMFEGRLLKGMPISAGYAEGPVRIVLSPDALHEVKAGEILVVPVIDPGMAPLLGLASGLIIEMGGMLSHGAIIAREYGIPAVANVQQATKVLQNGEVVAVDATAGEVRRLG